MNPLLAISIVLAAIASAPNLSAGGDAIDSPGPGYREQIDRLAAPIDRIAPVKTRVTQWFLVPRWLRSPEPALPDSTLSSDRFTGPSLFSLPYMIQTTPAPLTSHITLTIEATGDADIYDWEAFTPRMIVLPNQIELSQGVFEFCTQRLMCRIMKPGHWHRALSGTFTE